MAEGSVEQRPADAPDRHDRTPLLEVAGVDYRYGAISALSAVSLQIEPGEAVCVIGPNGAGKTTLARVCGGLYRPRSGDVWFRGEPLSRRPEKVVRAGVSSVLEGRHIFGAQSVATNLELGAYTRRMSSAEWNAQLERVFQLFPALASRSSQRAATLSGGQLQMVAIARALVSQPDLLILDEPSMGLSPKLAGEVFDALHTLQRDGLAILLIEQNAPLAFELATRGYLMRQGAIVFAGSTAEMSASEAVQSAYLGD